MQVVIHGTFDDATLAASTDGLVSAGSGGCNSPTAQSAAQAAGPFSHLLKLQ